MSKPVRKQSKRSPFAVLGYGIFLFFALAFGTIGGWLESSKVVQKVGILGLLHPKSPAEEFPGMQSMTVLVLGCDENRSTGGANITLDAARSDTMLVVKLDFLHDLVTGFNIPRDTQCALPGYKLQRINAYHAIGGNKMSQAAVEHLLGIKIDRTVTINYQGFRNMIDAVQGVYVDVPRVMNYDDKAGALHIHLKPGPQWLDGQTAEDFARFRHADSDIMRQNRQHLLIYAMQKRVEQRPQALTAVLDATAQMLSDGFNDDEIVSIGNWLKNVPSANMSFGVLPTRDAPQYELAMVKKDVPAFLAKYHFTSD